MSDFQSNQFRGGIFTGRKSAKYLVHNVILITFAPVMCRFLAQKHLTESAKMKFPRRANPDFGSLPVGEHKVFCNSL